MKGLTSNSTNIRQLYIKALPQLVVHGRQCYLSYCILGLKADIGAFLQQIMDNGHLSKLWSVSEESDEAQKIVIEELSNLARNGIHLISIHAES